MSEHICALPLYLHRAFTDCRSVQCRQSLAVGILNLAYLVVLVLDLLLNLVPGTYKLLDLVVLHEFGYGRTRVYRHRIDGTKFSSA